MKKNAIVYLVLLVGGNAWAQGACENASAFEGTGTFDADGAQILAASQSVETEQLEDITLLKAVRQFEDGLAVQSWEEWYAVEKVTDPTNGNCYTLTPVPVALAEIAVLKAEGHYGAERNQLAQGFRFASVMSSAVGNALDRAAAGDRSTDFGTNELRVAMATSAVSCFHTEEFYDPPELSESAARAHIAKATSATTWMMQPACYYYQLSQILSAMPEDTAAQARLIAEARAALRDAIEVDGPEEVGGSSAWRLEADDFEMTTQQDGAEITITSLATWVDTETFERRKQRMEGTMKAEGQTKDVFMETEFGDFRTVPGSNMIEPFRQTMRVGGMLTPQQEREIRQAQQQLEEFEAQLAAMPASQRSMMERMMGGQMDQMRSLASGGAVEFTIITDRIEINPDIDAEVAAMREGGGYDFLVASIQRDLALLDYAPGPINGQMNPTTADAIRRFESQNGMPVTGEPSEALAKALSDAVASL